MGEILLLTPAGAERGDVGVDKRQWWGINHALIWDVASWAVEMGELSSAQDVLDFWAKPWKYPELHQEWQLVHERG